MVPSLLSSSLSQGRTYVDSSVTTADVTTTLEKKKAYTNREAGISFTTTSRLTHFQRRVKPHLADDEARPWAAPILAWWDGS
jgi:hypothetical protein